MIKSSHIALSVIIAFIGGASPKTIFSTNGKGKTTTTQWYEEFQNLVDAFYEIEIKKRKLTRAELEPSQQMTTQFLEDESRLLDGIDDE